jgi:CMP-N-acetylneuraminic acid synthetase
LCIIPARSGSKRIINKNLFKRNGERVLKIQVEKAVQAGFDKIIIATDYYMDELWLVDYAEYKMSMEKVEIYNRKEADDDQTLYQLTCEVLREYEDAETVTILYPLALFCTSADLENGLNKLRNYDAVFPVVEAECNPHNILEAEGGQIKYVNPDRKDRNSHDIKKYYRHVGQFFMIKRAVLEREQTLIPRDCGYIVMDYALDIDTYRDLKLSEKYLGVKLEL